MMTCIEKIVSSTFHGYFLIFVNPNDLDLERIDRKSPIVCIREHLDVKMLYVFCCIIRKLIYM